MATPPTHIYHSMFLHEALTAVHSSYGYGLLTPQTDKQTDRQTDRQTISTVPSAHMGEGN